MLIYSLDHFIESLRASSVWHRLKLRIELWTISADSPVNLRGAAPNTLSVCVIHQRFDGMSDRVTVPHTHDFHLATNCWRTPVSICVDDLKLGAWIIGRVVFRLRKMHLSQVLCHSETHFCLESLMIWPELWGMMEWSHEHVGQIAQWVFCGIGGLMTFALDHRLFILKASMSSVIFFTQRNHLLL